MVLQQQYASINIRSRTLTRIGLLLRLLMMHTISVWTFLLSWIRKGSHYLQSLLSAKMKSFTHFTYI
ncbi:Uncharacterised protein [Enterobacter cloacae]|nr:Uncharacterised protein [Enterobacter cloacae]